MQVIVTGGRDYKDDVHLSQILRMLNPEYIYVGDCPTGADLYTKFFAVATNTQHKVYKADWDNCGKSAGPMRNREMVQEANARCYSTDLILLAFPGGAGTANCVKEAKALGITVLKVE